jgi:hypothetical protein
MSHRVKKAHQESQGNNRQKESKKGLGGEGSREPLDLAVIRKQITNLVGDQALTMVEATMGQVAKGHFAAMKYLFEMIGLFPATGQEEAPAENVLAKTLLHRLGLPEDPVLDNPVTKD